MKKWVLVLLQCFCLYSLPAQIAENEKVYIDLTYTKNNNQVELTVALRVKTISNTAFLVSKLRDWYGTTAIGQYMTKLEGTNGTTLLKDAPEDSIRVVPAHFELNLSYVIRYDSARIKNTYGPNTGVNHLHLFFCQWMLPLVPPTMVLEYVIHVNELPPHWVLYNSVTRQPNDIVIKQAYENAFSIVLGAGIFYKETFFLNGNPLDIYIGGKFDVPPRQLSALVYQTVAHQRNLFEDRDFAFYNVALLPKEENIAGISIANMFICHLKKDVPSNKLAWLLSHEMAHKWIGNQVRIANPGAFVMRHQWFHEGINDYLAYLCLLESKVYSTDQFVEGINQYLKNILENPFANAPEDSMIKVADRGKYGTAATKLAYYKGMLIGLLADNILAEDVRYISQSRLKAMLVQLAKMPKDTEGQQVLSEAQLFHIADSMQLPLRRLYQRHVIKGDPNFDLPGTIFKRLYKLKKVLYPTYDPGMTIQKRGDRLYASSVSPGGPAFRAGIREDMEIISSNDLPRFGNAWCDCPVTVVVNVHDVERKIVYLPHGKRVKVWQYVKR